ncbi:MAG: chemotaxis protein CheW [Verrucomicrobiota bacterium]|nr:chemotaxis protein CheW [Verrucomicrobiota bacterium]
MDAGHRAIAGKYLSFTLGFQSFAIEISKVREIIRLTEITHVPRMPRYISGIISLRGRCIPVLDLRIKFALPVERPSYLSSIMVLQISSPSQAIARVGLVVDAIEEVLAISKAEIGTARGEDDFIDSDYLVAITTKNGNLKLLLDIDRLVERDFLLLRNLNTVTQPSL